MPQAAHSTRVVLPFLAENTRSATVMKVLVTAGQDVRKGTPLFEMVTDKAAFDFESAVDGAVQALFVSANAEVPVGFVLALIGAGAPDAAEIADCEAQNRQALAAFQAAVGVADTARPATGAAPIPAARIRATPAARRLARESGIDLANVKRALGVDGMLREQDVARYIEGMK